MNHWTTLVLGKAGDLTLDSNARPQLCLKDAADENGDPMPDIFELCVHDDDTHEMLVNIATNQATTIALLQSIESLLTAGNQNGQDILQATLDNGQKLDGLGGLGGGGL